MTESELWLTRYEGDLYAAAASPGEPPSRPHRIVSVSSLYKRARADNVSITQVGIVPPDMLGLE